MVNVIQPHVDEVIGTGAAPPTYHLHLANKHYSPLITGEKEKEHPSQAPKKEARTLIPAQ